MTDEELTDVVGSVSDRAIADLRLDLIGWDSCVLAVRLIHERLKRIDIQSEPIAAVLQANYQGHEIWLTRDPGLPGHALLLVGDHILIDPTVNQLHERNEVFPVLDGFAMLLPEDTRVACKFGAGFRSKQGVHLRYDIDRTVPPFFLDSLDWTRPYADLERYVDHFKMLDEVQIRAAVEAWKKERPAEGA